MTVVGKIGACSVCRRTARLEYGGCPECSTKFGARFVELAARVRANPRFAAVVLGAIQDPGHREIFLEYFGADRDKPPPSPRHPIEE